MHPPRRSWATLCRAAQTAANAGSRPARRFRSQSYLASGKHGETGECGQHLRSPPLKLELLLCWVTMMMGRKRRVGGEGMNKADVMHMMGSVQVCQK